MTDTQILTIALTFSLSVIIYVLREIVSELRKIREAIKD